MIVVKEMKRENKQPIAYTIMKRGLFKKKLAPQGKAWLIVKFRRDKTEYTMKELIPTGAGQELEVELAENMIEELLNHYGI